MKDSSPFELPNPTEKLAYKFILDALQEKQKATLSESEPVIAPKPREEAPAVALPAIAELELPEGKKYFRIGEVATLIGVEPYVLRYWEGEFPVIKPTKSKTGHRVYGRKDVQSLHWIRHLLHVEKFSVQGAKKKMQEYRRQAGHDRQKNHARLRELAQGLRELIDIVKTNPGSL